MSRTRKRTRPAVPTLVTLAEWVDSGVCPTEALGEAGRLHVELTLALADFDGLGEATHFHESVGAWRGRESHLDMEWAPQAAEVYRSVHLARLLPFH